MIKSVDKEPTLRCCHNCMVMSVGIVCRRCGRFCHDVDVGMPSYFKVKLPARGTEELDRLYSFLFDELGASWAGRVGHYAYVDEGDEHQLATNQDGFLYCFIGPDGWMRRLTADSRLGDPAYPEVVVGGGVEFNYDLARMREHVESETVCLPKPEGDRSPGDIKAWLLSQGAGGQQDEKEGSSAAT